MLLGYEIVKTINRTNWEERVNTIPKPEKIAPATKYGGKIVVCQPGKLATAKSNETIVCTDKTRGVERPARSKYAISKFLQ